MIADTLKNRMVQSVTEPRAVARWLFDLRLDDGVLLMAFALVLVLNGLLTAFFNTLLPLNPVVAPLAANPFIYVGGLGAILAAVAVALTWSGRVLGGVANFRELATVLIWLQFLRLLAQTLVLFSALIMPMIASLLSLLASVAGIWIVLNFLAEAHNYPSLAKAAFALLLGMTAVALGLGVVISLLGITTTGTMSHV